jgi:hypothetical protein
MFHMIIIVDVLLMKRSRRHGKPRVLRNIIVECSYLFCYTSKPGHIFKKTKNNGNSLCCKPFPG